jgi:hypothetical protein
LSTTIFLNRRVSRPSDIHQAFATVR